MVRARCPRICLTREAAFIGPLWSSASASFQPLTTPIEVRTGNDYHYAGWTRRPAGPGFLGSDQ